MPLQKYIDGFFRDITSIGSVYTYGLLMLYFAAVQNWALLLQLFVGGVLTYAIATIVRQVHYKARPQKQAYTNWFEKIDSSSFPSIHSARSVFLFFVLGAHFKSTVMYSLLAVGVITILYSRIYLKKHDVYDLIGGAVLGLVLGIGVPLIL